MNPRVTFEVSLGECADLALKGRRRIQRVIHWLIMSGTGVVVLFAGIRSADRFPQDYVIVVIGALMAVVVGHVTAESFNRWQVRRALGPIFRRHGRLVVAVEIQEKGLLFQQFGTDVLIHWSEIASAERSELGVEIRSPERWVALVRDRAFGSEDEAVAFLDEIRRRACLAPDQGGTVADLAELE